MGFPIQPADGRISLIALVCNPTDRQAWARCRSSCLVPVPVPVYIPGIEKRQKHVGMCRTGCSLQVSSKWSPSLADENPYDTLLNILSILCPILYPYTCQTQETTTRTIWKHLHTYACITDRLCNHNTTNKLTCSLFVFVLLNCFRNRKKKTEVQTTLRVKIG